MADGAYVQPYQDRGVGLGFTLYLNNIKNVARHYERAGMPWATHGWVPFRLGNSSLENQRQACDVAPGFAPAMFKAGRQRVAPGQMIGSHLTR